MPGKMHFLTDKDVRKVKRLIGSANAGTPSLSRRPVPTSRTPRGRDGGAGNVRLVKITGTITARSGTTLGSGTVQPVDPSDLTTNLGSTFTAYNYVTRALSGATETVYCRAIRIGPRWFIDALDPIWFLNYTGAAAGAVLGFDDSATTAELEFRQGIEDVQVDAANFQLEKKVFGGSFTDYHTGGEC